LHRIVQWPMLEIPDRITDLAAAASEAGSGQAPAAPRILEEAR